MQIGIDARLPFYERGGISRYVINLLKALAEIDSENHYTIFHSRKDTHSYLPEKVNNFHRSNLWTPCHHKLERWTLAGELSLHGLDVMHSPDFIPPAFGARRRIITIHDINFYYNPEFLTKESRRYYLGQIEWAVQEADHISADSHHTRYDLIERLNVPHEKVTTIHLAADPIYSLRQDPASISLILERYALSKGFILFVGTISPRKNLSTLLNSYRLLLDQIKIDAQLVLVGSRGWQSELILEEIKNLSLTHMVSHLAGLTDETLAGLYSTAGALVLPSYYEGFGFPALEAMLSGCPVIASDRGSLPEVVGDAGLLLDPDDVDAWAGAMEKVIEDITLRERLIAAGKIQARKFSWKATARKTLELYNI